ncbi:phosphatidate cytidylyltransferase [Sulfuricella sp. T08]|uniref:phosphatidate cytidylyltransferase n=1 Tax=Sulfuricella sp. T08 TaxID=1632857 RepID=UPI000617A18B|nr:phosphatidate cytidylyltransferase [Sulfuricella sp. T08]GAO35731.1 phosphatidate cytidylyltransferase [Sulfuricella sp. T08]
MLKTRVLTVLLLLPLFLAALFLLPDMGWALLMLGVVLLIGAREWSKISAFSGFQGWVYVLLTLFIGLALLPESSRSANFMLYGIAFLFWALLVPLWLHNQWRTRHWITMALIGWVVLIPTWLALVELRDLAPGLLLGLLAMVWIADTAAYFAGRKFGRHKLAPTISPGKTWEGVAGAFLGVTLYGMTWGICDSSIVLFSSGLWLGILLLWLLTLFSILGDLFESWMKRVAGLKDSGQILPGHGGILDRIDALTAAMPIAAFGLLLIKNYNLVS